MALWTSLTTRGTCLSICLPWRPGRPGELRDLTWRLFSGFCPSTGTRSHLRSPPPPARLLPLSHHEQIRFHDLSPRTNSDHSQAMARASNCLDMYLSARPTSSADFLSALQALPEWLRDGAVLNEHVQNVLNHKIVRRFPTCLLILDFYFLMIIIICTTINSKVIINHIYLKNKENEENTLPNRWTLPVILQISGGVYFLLREIIQAAAMSSLGLFQSWLCDVENWLGECESGCLPGACFGPVRVNQKPQWAFHFPPPRGGYLT